MLLASSMRASYVAPVLLRGAARAATASVPAAAQRRRLASSSVAASATSGATSTSSASPSAAPPPDTEPPRTGHALEPLAAESGSEKPPAWRLKLLHDSDCPLCEREVSMLKRRDAERHNVICFVDVADPNYDPRENCGVDYEAAMRTIHGIVPSDGDENKLVVMTGVDVFKRAYELVGLGWVYAFLDVPVLKKLASTAYDAWARIRLPLTGRPALEVVLAEKKTCRDVVAGGEK